MGCVYESSYICSYFDSTFQLLNEFLELFSRDEEISQERDAP